MAREVAEAAAVRIRRAIAEGRFIQWADLIAVYRGMPHQRLAVRSIAAGRPVAGGPRVTCPQDRIQHLEAALEE